MEHRALIDVTSGVSAAFRFLTGVVESVSPFGKDHHLAISALSLADGGYIVAIPKGNVDHSPIAAVHGIEGHRPTGL